MTCAPFTGGGYHKGGVFSSTQLAARSRAGDSSSGAANDININIDPNAGRDQGNDEALPGNREENDLSPRSRRTSTRLMKNPPTSPETMSHRNWASGGGGKINVNAGGDQDEHELRWRDREENDPSPRSRRTSTRLMKSPRSPKTPSRLSAVAGGGGGAGYPNMTTRSRAAAPGRYPAESGRAGEGKRVKVFPVFW